MLDNSLFQTAIGAVITALIGGFGYWLRHLWRKAKALNDLIDEPNDVENDEADKPLKHDQLEDLKELIKTLTYPLQPNANGGKSLPDLISLVQTFKEDLTERVDRIETRQIVIGDTAIRTESKIDLHITTKNAHS